MILVIWRFFVVQYLDYGGGPTITISHPTLKYEFNFSFSVFFFFFFLIENPWACRERASCNGLAVGLACRGLLGLVLLFYFNLFFQILVQIFFWGFFFFFFLA